MDQGLRPGGPTHAGEGVTLIHRSAWKVNSQKFVCSIVDSRPDEFTGETCPRLDASRSTLHLVALDRYSPYWVARRRWRVHC